MEDAKQFGQVNTSIAEVKGILLSQNASLETIKENVTKVENTGSHITAHVQTTTEEKLKFQTRTIWGLVIGLVLVIAAAVISHLK